MINKLQMIAAIVAALLFAVDAVGAVESGGSSTLNSQHLDSSNSQLPTDLWREFVNPPPQARPWCYWWWINGHVDRETITADLEAIRRLGFGGVLMFDSRGYRDDEEHVVNPKAELEWGSAEWQELVTFSIRECARLGLVFTMNASASGGTLNGFRDGREYEVDITDRNEVAGHLDRAVGPILKRVPDLVGRVFTHIYSVSYEGNIKQGAGWSAIKDSFYAEMSQWAHRHGLKVYSESGGPWFWGAETAKLDCDQLDLLAHNDMPQGEFWPHERTFTAGSVGGHANRNGRFFIRAPVLAARRGGRKLVSMEAFTHMQRHYSVDPAFLKPLADIAYADGVNHLVWHTFTCSPKRFGVPGAEYFAGSHINRNVTWHEDAAAFVGYLGRCQALLQRGEPVDDGEFRSVSTNYYGWGRYRVKEMAQFTTTHRREGNVDIFFVAGEGAGTVELNAGLDGRAAEIWDAVTATRKPADATGDGSGKTRVKLDLPVGGSCFVVLAAADREGLLKASAQERRVQAERRIEGPWRVEFRYHDGVEATPPASMTMAELRDFSSFGEEGKADGGALRYFSGTAVYRTTVTLSAKEAGKLKVLSLGCVPSGLAHVSVNGVDCGTVWCHPWTADVSAAVREGENAIEIRYVNNWYNRLVGDCFLPEGERVTKSLLRYWKVRRGRRDPKRPGKTLPTNCSGPSMFDTLQPSGLLGPVCLREGGSAND